MVHAVINAVITRESKMCSSSGKEGLRVLSNLVNQVGPVPVGWHAMKVNK